MSGAPTPTLLSSESVRREALIPSQVSPVIYEKTLKVLTHVTSRLHCSSAWQDANTTASRTVPEGDLWMDNVPSLIQGPRGIAPGSVDPSSVPEGVS